MIALHPKDVDKLSDALAHWRELHSSALAAYGPSDDVTVYYRGRALAVRDAARTVGLTFDHLLGKDLPA